MGNSYANAQQQFVNEILVQNEECRDVVLEEGQRGTAPMEAPIGAPTGVESTHECTHCGRECAPMQLWCRVLRNRFHLD